MIGLRDLHIFWFNIFCENIYQRYMKIQFFFRHFSIPDKKIALIFGLRISLNCCLKGLCLVAPNLEIYCILVGETRVIISVSPGNRRRSALSKGGGQKTKDDWNLY